MHMNTNDREMSQAMRILLVEYEEHDKLTFQRSFRKAHIPCRIIHCVRAEETWQHLRDPASFDIVVSDYNLPGMSGLDLFKQMTKARIRLPFVILTGAGSEALAVEALKAGVDDYIIKKYMTTLLPVVLQKVVQRHTNRTNSRRSVTLLKNTRNTQIEEQLRQSSAKLKAVEEQLQQEIAKREQAEEALRMVRV